jgi:hypothetical protein
MDRSESLKFALEVEEITNSKMEWVELANPLHPSLVKTNKSLRIVKNDKKMQLSINQRDAEGMESLL